MLYPGRGVPGKSSYMQFIDHTVPQGRQRLFLYCPVEIIMDYPGFVKGICRQLFSPLALSCHCLGIGIQEIFLFLEQKPSARIIGTVHGIGIFKFIDLQTKDKHRIHISHPVIFRERYSGIRLLFLPVKQQQLTGCGRMGNNGKIHTFRKGRGTVNLIKSRTYLESVDTVQRL